MLNQSSFLLVKGTTGGLWPSFLLPVVALDILLQGHLSISGLSTWRTSFWKMMQIAWKTYNRFICHIPTDRGYHHNIGSWVCDGSTRMPMAMKQSCYRGCSRALWTPSGGLKGTNVKMFRFYWAHLCNLHGGLLCVTVRLSVQVGYSL